MAPLKIKLNAQIKVAQYKEGKVAIKLLRDNNGAQRSVNLEHMISSVAELLTQID
jgi:hypothetical protein